MARVVAHLIVGVKPEPVLPSMLASLAGSIEHVFVNENSGLGSNAPALAALESSSFARESRLTMRQTHFTTFSEARNVCFSLDTRADEDTWIVFIDADEVHGEKFGAIAGKLGRLPRSISFVDGYTWHFFKSYDWYLSIERRMMFHRWSPHARWEGNVHEQLTGISGKRVALPYVYAHYGHVVPFAETARREAQYAQLGAPGTLISAQDAHAADVDGNYGAAEHAFADWWRKCMRFTGEHPPAARLFIEQEKLQRRKSFADMEAIIAKYQPLAQRAKNAVMKLNYEQRWRLRAFEAARLGML